MHTGMMCQATILGAKNCYTTDQHIQVTILGAKNCYTNKFKLLFYVLKTATPTNYSVAFAPKFRSQLHR